MAFDPVAYGRMLDEALGYSAPAGGPRQGGGMQPMPGPEIGATPPFTDSGEGPWAEELPAQRGGRPMAMQTIDGQPSAPGASIAQTPEQPAGRNSLTQPVPEGDQGKLGKIAGKPPFKIEYKKGGLKDVKTFSDVMGAMKPKSQAKYMEWWEQQYGDINERYNQLQQMIGKRPDPNADLNKKDQFRMLMEFGIELMARSGRGEQGAGGTALAGSYGRARDRKELETADHDARSQLAEKNRQEELKTIGSYGDALKGQSTIDQNEVQMEEARARTKNANRRKPEIIQADQGTYDYDTETMESRPILGIDGKPLTNKEVGSRGGSAAGRDSRTANQKNIEDLVARGVPEQLATDIVYRRVTDPRKAWENLYRDRRRQYASDSEAKAETDRVIGELYGEDWQSNPTNAKIDKADPLGLR